MTKRQINLLTQNKFNYSGIGKLVSWATNVGRWIVVLTEFVVICAFLSRFYFDTKLANLFDEIRQKKAMVNSSYTFEEQYRQAQEKIKTVKIIMGEESNRVGVLSQVASKIPLDTTITNMTIDVNLLTITGYSLSSDGLSQFISGLNAVPDLEKIKVDKLEIRQDEQSGINFLLTGNIKKGSS